MKKLLSFAVLSLAAGGTAMATITLTSYTSGFDDGGKIADGNVNPWSDLRAVSAPSGETITGVKVRLNIAGGYNGDLVGYLSYNHFLVPLLNRVGVGSSDATGGFGYDDSGLNVTFSDGAANNIHFYQGVGGYSIGAGALWQPDGRSLDSVNSLPSAFDASGALNLGVFNGMDPNGNWTLVLADVSPGGGQTTVLDWGLDIETSPVAAVPEPSSLLAAGLLSLSVVASAIRRRRSVKK